MPTLPREWLTTGAAAVTVAAIALVALHTKPAAAVAVTVPLLGAASIALWIGRTISHRSARQRARAGAAMVWCIAASAALAVLALLA